MLPAMESSARSDVETICSFEGRLPGSDAERRLGNRLAAGLDSSTRRLEVEPSYVQPQWAIVHLLHCGLAAAGSMLAAVEPAIGFGLVLVAATSAYLDLSARFYLLRRLLFRRASQNVYAPAIETDPDVPRVILCANLDAPRTGAVYNRRPMRLLDAVAGRLPVASSPTRLWFWSIALLLPPLGARMAGVDVAWLSVLQLPQTLILVAAMFALGEIALSPASPGANANASGTAAVLAAARRLDAEPPENLAVDVLLCGGGETTMQGMRSFVRSHREGLDRGTTRFVSLESVGRGDPRFVRSQGLAISLPMDPELGRLCEAIALAGSDPDHEAAGMRDGSISAAWVARAYGYPAIAITAREEGRALPPDHHTPADVPADLDPAAIERAATFAEQLVRLLDRDLARTAGTATQEPALEAV